MTKLTLLAATVTLALTGIAGCANHSRSIEPRTDQAMRRIDPRADQALRQMSKTLAEAQTLQVQSSATSDEPVAGGQLAQVTRNSTIRVHRPHWMFAEIRRGSDLYKLWFQEGELTVLDVQQNAFCRVQTPRRIDQMLDFLADTYGVEIPLSDLLYPDPYAVLTERVSTGTYAGQEEMEGRLCDHLLFTQENVDWQIWISSGKEALPCKVVITYKQEEGAPQFVGVMNDWRLSAENGASWAVPQVPSNARLVSYAEIFGRSEEERP